MTPASITAVTPSSLGPEEKVCALISDVLHQGERGETDCEIREDEVATADATANGCLSNKTPFVKTEVSGTGGWNYKRGT